MRTPAPRLAPAAGNSPPTPWPASPRRSGLALPGSAGTPAPFESRDLYAEASGEAVMNLLRLGIRPRDIVTREALENAATVVAASGGSTNAGLHLPAIANEAGIDFDLHEVGRDFPAHALYRRFQARRALSDEGPPRCRRRAGADEGAASTAAISMATASRSTGKTVAENLREVKFPTDQDVVRPTSAPLVADRRGRRAQGQSRARRARS